MKYDKCSISRDRGNDSAKENLAKELTVHRGRTKIHGIFVKTDESVNLPCFRPGEAKRF